MKMRLLCLGLLISASQLFATGCHPVDRWRANHPGGVGCGTCAPCMSARPMMHPIQTRRAVMGEAVGPVYGPVVSSPPCHGCGGSNVGPGVPVTFHGAPGDLVPVNHPPAGYPAIGYPVPITPGPMVVPSYELPSPMPVKPPTGGN